MIQKKLEVIQYSTMETLLQQYVFVKVFKGLKCLSHKTEHVVLFKSVQKNGSSCLHLYQNKNLQCSK